MVFVLPAHTSDEFRTGLAEELGKVVVRLLPTALVQVFTPPFNRSQGFWMSENEQENSLLSMSIGEYLTAERYQRAGFDPERFRARTIHGCNEVHGWYFIDGQDSWGHIPITTVGQLLNLGRWKFSRVRNIGEKSCDALRKIFEMDGLGEF